MFWCKYINILCFVGIGLVLSKKYPSVGYNDQIAVVYIFHRAMNSQAITWDRRS